jgi:hypothetical protein
LCRLRGNCHPSDEGFHDAAVPQVLRHAAVDREAEAGRVVRGGLHDVVDLDRAGHVWVEFAFYVDRGGLADLLAWEGLLQLGDLLRGDHFGSGEVAQLVVWLTRVVPVDEAALARVGQVEGLLEDPFAVDVFFLVRGDAGEAHRRVAFGDGLEEEGSAEQRDGGGLEGLV